MYLKITVKPSSKIDSIVENNSRYMISCREPAKGGRANTAAKVLLARHLGVSEKVLALVRGADRPSKLFIVRNSPK